MAAELTPAELTLLGLLVEQPRHGYEIDEVITARGMREWTEIGFSSIYYLLGRLRDRGLIVEIDTPKAGRGKARHVYGPTAEGREECARAAEAAIAQVRPVFPPVLVGIANQPLIPPDRLHAALATRADALAEQAAALRHTADAQRDAPEFVRALFDYSLNQLDAEQTWLSAYRASLRTGRTAMAPYDVKRELKDLYAPKNTTWALVDVPEQQFLAIDGRGNPNTAPAYADAVAALYAVAYTIKFASKRDGGRDFVVAPLEGLWWSDTPANFTTHRAKDTWQWTMLISLPEWISKAVVEDARDAALAKKKLPAIAEVRRHTLHEGRCAQALHIGPYDDEGPLLASLHDEWLAAHQLRETGIHHEIYLGDPRRTEPAKLRTVLRQPVTSL